MSQKLSLTGLFIAIFVSTGIAHAQSLPSASFMSQQQVDLTLTKTGPQGTTVQAGSTITYQLDSRNKGPDTAYDVTVTDYVPNGLSFNAAQSHPACVRNGSQIHCHTNSMAAGEQITYNVAFTVSTNPNYCGKTISNTASISTSSTEIYPPDNQAGNITHTIECASTAQSDVRISKSGPSTVNFGNTILYTLTVTNDGPGTALSVTADDTVPTGLTYNASKSSPACVLINNNVICDQLPTLAAGSSKQFTVAFDVQDPSACGQTIQNTATVSVESTDPNPANNVSNTVRTTVNCPVQQADLSIAKTGPAHVLVGNSLVYTVTVTNNGPDAAANTTVVDPIPNGLTYNANASDPRCQKIGLEVVCVDNSPLAANRNRSFNLSFTVPSTATCGSTITNRATITSTTQDPNTGNNQSQNVSTTVNCQNPTFTISKTDNKTTASPGEILDYVIKVKNTSAVNATNITVIDALPSELMFISASDNGTLNNSSVTWNGLSIVPGGTKTLTLKVKILQSTLNQTVITNAVNVVGGPVATDDTTVVVQSQLGCIDIVKQAFDELNNPIFPVPEFTFHLNGNLQTTTTDSNGHGWFTPVPAGTYTVSEVVPNGWELVSVTPANGVVQVTPGTTCVSVLFKNKQTTVQQPSFTISKTDNKTTASPGEALNYVITVKNVGTAAATNVSIVDTLPSNVTVTSIGQNGVERSDGTVHWDNQTFAVNEEKTFTLTVTINANATNNTQITNVAEVVGGPNATDITTVVTQNQMGCIDIVKETFDTNGNPITPVAQFTFNLDGNVQTTTNNSQGIAKFSQVPAGTHTVTEVIPTNWKQLSVTPSNGIVQVQPGATCSTVLFKNQQTIGQNQTFAITKTDNRSTVNPGETLTYNIDVTNTSTVNATNVQVIDALPSEVTFVSASNGGVLNGTSVEWNNLSITAGQTISLTLTVTVNSGLSNGTSIVNTATVTGGPIATDTTTVTVGQPVLTISKTDNRSTVNVGETLNYVITVNNTSNVNATGVQIIDTVPSELQILNATTPSTINGQTVTWSNLSITANSSLVLNVNAQVRNGTANNTLLLNTVQIVGGNSATDSTTVQTSTNNTNITIDLTDLRDPVRPDETFCYNIRLTNLNNTQVNNLTVTQTLDSQTDYVSASDGGSHSNRTITWNNISINASGTRTLGSCVRVDEDAEDNDLLQSTAFASNQSDNETTRVEDDDDDNNNECRIQNINDNPDPVRPGETLTYDIRVENESNRDREFDIRAYLDSRVSFLSASRGGDDIGSREVEWENFDIDENETETVRLTVRVRNDVSDGDTIRIQVHCEDDTDSESTRVEGSGTGGEATLSIDKSANRHEAKPGDTVIYTLTIRNLSSRAANNVRIEDRFTSGSISIEDAGGGTVAGNGINWTIPVLSSNQTRTFSYRVRVGGDMRHGQIIANTVRATSPDVSRDATDLEEVRVITDLPQTGLSSFYRAWQQNNQNIKPSEKIRENSTATNSTKGVWATVMSVGLMAGGVIGRRYWL